MGLELPRLDPCPFCAIERGEADGWPVVARDELTLTLLNARQYETGQCLVLPRRHAPTLTDLSAREGAAVFDAAQRLMETMTRLMDPDGVLLYQNNGVGSGQEVPHFHLHVVPRNPGSDWGLGPPHLARLQREPAPPHLDHRVVTPAKRRTARLLSEALSGDAGDGAGC